MKIALFFAVFSIVLVSCDSPGGSSTTPGLPVSTAGNPGGGSQTSPVTLDSEEAAFVVLINAYRVQNGLTPLQVSVTLTESSKWLNQDMIANNYFDHTDSLGRDPGTRMFFFGYPSNASDWGENIAAGNATAQDTFTQWKNSPPHNANMLGSGYAAIGVGRAYGAASTYGWYWTTDFGSVVDSVMVTL